MPGRPFFAFLSTASILALAAAPAGCGNPFESACSQLATAICDKSRECQDPEIVAGDYCQSRYNAVCKAYYGVDGANVAPADVQACADATTAQTCAEIGTTPEACRLTGYKGTDELCSMSFECESGACVKVFGETCGTCAAKAPAVDDVCDQEVATCAASGLYCRVETSACEAFGKLGESCADTYPCVNSLQCAQGKCGYRLAEGADCDPANPACELTMACNGVTHKCERFVVAHAGEPCGPDPATGKTLVCTLDTICYSDPVGAPLACQVPVKEGEMCDSTYPHCELGSTCQDGRCVTAVLACE